MKTQAEHGWKAEVGFPLTSSATIAQVGLGTMECLFPPRPVSGQNKPPASEFSRLFPSNLTYNAVTSWNGARFVVMPLR